MDENYLRGMLAGAILGVSLYVLLRQRLNWYDRELERLDRNFQDHVLGDAHPPPAAPHAEL